MGMAKKNEEVKTKVRNVVAYCRVSTDGQTGDDKFGIESQKEIVMSYCAAHGMQISDWYIDEGESGAKEKRPELDRLLFGEVKNPPVEAVIVPKSDRMARDIKLYFYYMMLLEKKNIHLISATEEVVNDDTGLGNVYKALMMFVAEQERANITKRTSGGRKQKAAQGGYSGGQAPFGYRVENGKLVINEKEAAVVRFILERKRNGETMLSTMYALNDNGYKNRHGNRFAISSVQSVWNNEKTYYGWYKYSDGDWVKGLHEPIMTGKDSNGESDAREASK